MWPKELVRATSLATIQDIARRATNEGRRVRVVGSGLSFSDVLKADDILLETSDLMGVDNSGLLPTESNLWREPQPRRPTVTIACGAKIRLLNATLAQAGLAFTNLGGYDMQTMVGAIATSTHGSGLRLGALPDAVISLDMVTQSGDVVRIEPTAGPTDRAKFEQRYGSTKRLEQDDGLFHAAVVSMGCMGIIYSVTMEVSPAFRLIEHRRVKSWSTVKLELEESLTRFRNYEVFLNPYPRRDGDYDCLVTERNVAPPDAPTIPLPAGETPRRGAHLSFVDPRGAGPIDDLRTTAHPGPFADRARRIGHRFGGARRRELPDLQRRAGQHDRGHVGRVSFSRCKTVASRSPSNGSWGWSTKIARRGSTSQARCACASSRALKPRCRWCAVKHTARSRSPSFAISRALSRCCSLTSKRVSTSVGALTGRRLTS